MRGAPAGRWAVVALLALWWSGCAATAAPAARTRTQVVQSAAPETDERDPLPQVRVRGLTGTLNRDDVHQTMDARQDAFDVCINAVRRNEAWVDGTLRFDFQVDRQGHVEQVLPSESTLGHRDLERCLARVVSETEFPRPAGRATARFSWDVHVEPGRRPADAMDASKVQRVVSRKARDVFVGCKVRRFKNRFDVTAYVGTAGRVLSAGAVAARPQPEGTLDCVLTEVSRWRLPRPRRVSKVSFSLR